MASAVVHLSGALLGGGVSVKGCVVQPQFSIRVTNTVGSQSVPRLTQPTRPPVLLHSPVGALVKGLCRRESQHSAGDAAAAEVPAVAAHVTPLPAVLHLQHSLRHQAAMVARQDRPETGLLQLD